ncbi:MAG: hypothetical protein PHH52_00875 [Patescibacteria group bacterium]|jgi:hypothetical protein|nr:hypothetical protein [Patescibacteria group bacterium]MDD3777921.1 hypothetical protein [Patescibacteria group bacterium]MDD3939512.1 hypothetical protein [Patescibacteria group bacterium]MDD4443737.1 hypothetical protein [Patescibacteria group bacterium]NCU39673.1 hypothetical protein [Candidatus Falkowbacteria bacterium]
MRKKTINFIEITLIVIFIIILFFFSLWLLERGKLRADDARKLADIKKIQSALALYYHENNDYPEVLEVGKALQNKGKIYLDTIPRPPVSKGSCASNLDYNYTKRVEGDRASSYFLEYCLSQDSADIPAGLNTATPQGISLKKIN